MRIKRCLYIIIVLCFMSLFFTGCWDNKIYEKIGFILDVAIDKGDKGDKGDIKVTYTYPVLEKNKKKNVTIINISGGLLRDSREKARQKSPRLIEGGKIQNILVSKKLAQEGVHDIITLFERDPLLPLISRLSIVDGECDEFIKKSNELIDKPIPSIHINQLLSNNEKIGIAKETRLYQYDIDFFLGNRDPIVPMLKIDNNDIVLEKSALFHKDKMVGEVTPEQTSLLLDIRENNSAHEIIFHSLSFDNLIYNNSTAMMLKQKDKRIEIDLTSKKPMVDIYIKYNAIADDFPWYPIDKDDEKKKIEDICAKELEKNFLKVLKYTQEIGSDPIGIGHIICAKYNKYWESINWDETYKDISFKVHPSITIKKFGVIK